MFEVNVPILPESIIQATVVKWHKTPGEKVKADEVIVEVETDKVVMEIPAEFSGVLREIKAKEGDLVSEDQLLALIEREKEDELINNQKVDYVNKDGGDKTHTAEEMPAGVRTTERVRTGRARKAIIRKLKKVSERSVMVTTFNEVDMGAINDIRSEYKDAFMKKYNVKLGLMSFFVKASVDTLKKFPTVNAYLEDEEMVYHAYCDISIAISTDRGLIVPVLKDAHKMGMHDVEMNILNFSKKSKDGTLTMDDMVGGTFTITNGGVFGSLLSTPIINAPQSAILGMHKIQKRAVVIDDEIVIRPMMNLALTYDHQIIDGKEAIEFLSSIKDLLEDPVRLLLKV